MHIGVKSLLAAAVLGLSGLAAPAGAQDARLVSYEELLDRVARLEEETAAAPAPDGEGKDAAIIDEPIYDDGGWYAVYENVIVTPYFSQNTSALVIGPGGIASKIREFNWDMEYSSRFEIGNVDACTGTGWRARYWHFDHSTDDRAVVPAGVTVLVAPLPSRFGIVTNAGDTSSATHSLRMSVLDMEFLKRDMDAEGGFTASFGLRYARIDNWLNARDISAAGVLLESLRQQHNFEGIGPTIAAEYLKRFDCSYWGMFINARGSLLYGESNLRYDHRGAGGALGITTVDTNDQDLLAVTEIQIGLDYRRPTCSCHEIFLRVALEAQYWASGGSASAQQGTSGDNSAQDTNLGFLGVTIATGLDW
jgi:hypothetical protein